MFDWCAQGKHDECIRAYERFYIDPRTNKPVFTDETVYCNCRKRGCKCYVKPADRPKPKRRTTRKKK